MPSLWAAIRLHSRAESQRHLKTYGLPTSIPGVSLADQFNYRYATVEESEAAAFAIALSESVFLLVAIFRDPSRYAAAKMERAVRTPAEAA